MYTEDDRYLSDMIIEQDIRYKDKLIENMKSVVEEPGISLHKTRPFYTYQEIVRFQMMYGTDEIKDLTFYKEFLDNLKDESHGYITECAKDITNKWQNIILKLLAEQHRGKDVDNLMRLYGWNPVMEFNATNMSKANKRFESVIYENVRERIVDLTNDIEPLDEATKKKTNINWTKVSLKPVYIVLVEGDTPIFSDLTKIVTKGPFSHAAIGLDAKLDELYSFNLKAGKNDNRLGGFSIENVKNYPKDGKLGVFCIFVKEDDLINIRAFIDNYIKNMKKTSYSILNIFTLPTNIAIKMDFNMICSEFVDAVLKVCDIDISEKPSPLVTPNDFYRSAQKNKKIYKLYEGLVANYRPDRIISKLFRIQPTVSTIKEAAEFPVQFSKDGDLLIKHMDKIDFEREYNNSHRLLQNYEKTGNVDGMKYELSKLWFLNLMLERNIYYNTDDKNKTSYTKCRARVLNDFNKYLKIVLVKDPAFNFDEYFNNSPFNHAVTKVNASTLKYSIEYMKRLLSPV